MTHFLKVVLSFGVIPFTLMSCSTTPPKAPSKTKPQSQRIHISSQNQATFEQSATAKVIPYSYNAWMAVSNNLYQVREYEKFLDQNQVGNIVPSYELLRSARDWQKCGHAEYEVPPQELWANQIPTLKVFKYLIASRVLTDFTVTSVYRNLALNRCAGGAASSRHVMNSAIDFRIGPEYPQPADYMDIENTKFRLCRFWSQYGQALNMGLGLYASGQIHIDTQGYRTWGPDTSRQSSMCVYE
ncbi:MULTISPECIES: D-Ala-D-Ala carboxypeptidase family metallohydrolase [unclassified Acinetobacter]|uniref:D-Ala-D-Ala carboxypeptidase family metallohydrolase n=1 Tax=unclassified Acinetobacter TaxID=196816 RepID=UPI002934BB0B|nr:MULTISPECIES: D-Ala-D-Ala carboxypeptidase family metallohydrolase [unclassified Acinetobacter]WOE32550.1 D-Ala-D-Ala carboxypeptidase family metallohydrolase [Acinetobacter sp. SAAs470]WOE38026.1 D-Ala-D-Ala carboxypeptidase family metallohydrolase [Acinetobacter sp. SAAs474]